MKLIGDEILESFKKLVECNIGLSIRTEESPSFRKTLSTRMKVLNIAVPDQYLSFLASEGGAAQKEWKTLILMTTTGESYFFRDKGHFLLLQNSILPELINNNENLRSLRIWSAGCSTGEEPYSLAILLEMLLPDLKEWRIEILGTDINEEFLRKAERGVYSDWSFRMLDKDIQRKYFKPHPDGWEIHERFRKMVKFQYGNLLEEGFYSQYPEMCGMDIIICRNVFIYFNPETVSSVLNNFRRLLKIGGYLITGHGELHGLDLSSLRQLISAEGVIYRRVSESIEENPPLRKSPERITESANLNIRRKAVHKPRLSDPATVSKSRDIKAEIEELISRGKYAEAVDKSSNFMVDNNERYCILYTISQAYADLGEYDRAEVCCRRAIDIDAESADPYFLLAQIAEARGNHEEAIELLNKAIYLNPSFIAAYCELGALYERHDNPSRAKKFRNTAVELLMSQNPGMPVKPYDITSGELLASIRELINS